MHGHPPRGFLDTSTRSPSSDSRVRLLHSCGWAFLVLSLLGCRGGMSMTAPPDGEVTLDGGRRVDGSVEAPDGFVPPPDSDVPAPDAGTVVACERPEDCDDGLPCTQDACTAGACTHTPDDSFCGRNARCNPSTGCEALPACEGVVSPSNCRRFPTPCGCAASEQCAPAMTPDGRDAWACFPTGTREEFETCDASVTCRDGLCVDGRCRTVCRPEDPTTCSRPGSTCQTLNGTRTDFGVCTAACQLAPNSCPLGLTCAFSAGSTTLTDCFAGGTLPIGSACDPAMILSCAAGSLCAPYGAGGLCTSFCRFGVDADCAGFPGTRCQANSPAIVAGVAYGACFP
jgi:hypothetical protein